MLTQDGFVPHIVLFVLIGLERGFIDTSSVFTSSVCVFIGSVCV
jgi:hypothetical protein